MAIKNFKPQKVTDTVENPDILPEWRAPQFFYMHHTDSWEFIDGEWLPRLKRWRLVPGVNGVQPGPNGYRVAKANYEADGWTVLPHNCPVIYTDPESGELIEDSGYLCSLRGRGGKVYTDVWHTPIVMGAGRTASVNWKDGFDREGFDLWRKMLMAKGFIGKPNPMVLSSLIEIQKRRTDRNASKAVSGNPYAIAKFEDEKVKLAAMEASISPPKRRGRKKKAVVAHVE